MDAEQRIAMLNTGYKLLKWILMWINLLFIRIYGAPDMLEQSLHWNERGEEATI